MRILSFIVPITYLQLPTNRAANHAASELPLPSVASGFLLALPLRCSGSNRTLPFPRVDLR